MKPRKFFDSQHKFVYCYTNYFSLKRLLITNKKKLIIKKF